MKLENTKFKGDVVVSGQDAPPPSLHTEEGEGGVFGCWRSRFVFVQTAERR